MELIHGILQRYPEATVSVQEAASNAAAACAHDHPMVEILARRAEEVMPGGAKKRPLAIPSLGATDCKFWRYCGVPAFVYGVGPEGMGRVDESVDVEEFEKVVRMHTLAAWEFLGGEA